MYISRINQVEDACKEITRKFKYNSIISYEYIEKLLGVDRYDYRFTFIFSSIKEALVEYGFILKPLINEGYMVLHPRDVADYVMKKNVILPFNKLQKGLKILNYVDRKELNDLEKDRLDNLYVSLSSLKTENENKILNIQLQLNEARAKELCLN